MAGSEELSNVAAQRLPHDQFDLRAYGERNASRGAATSTQEEVWRVELSDRGEVGLIFGPGSVNVPLDEGAVAYAVSEAYEDAAEGFVPAEAWFCDNQVPARVTLGLPPLGSYVGVACTGNRPGQIRIGYNFESSRWWGWGRYNDTRYTSWTEAQAQGTDVYEYCNRDGSYHEYRVRSWLEVRGTPWQQLPAEVGFPSNQYGCGEGV